MSTQVSNIRQDVCMVLLGMTIAPEGLMSKHHVEMA